MQSRKLLCSPLGALVAIAGWVVMVGEAFGQTKLLRFPDIHGDSVVFCHGGDLWKVGVEELLRRMREQPRRLPSRPSDPVKLR